MSEQHDDLIGKTLGQYEIQEEIGRGGMATVYRARQISMNRTVAVKVLPRHFLHDPGFYERFEREVDVIAHLEHPHILPIYDFGRAESVPYIAMRYLGGGSMAQMVRRGPTALMSLDRPFSQVAQALDHAHRQGIIHRDLKPGNIMLDENGNAYLSDFGIARIMGSNLTGSMIIGTPAYMSPEQANGLPLDGRSDLYSLGVVLFELITGSEPYHAETPMALLLKHINEPMPPLSNFRPDIPDSVELVIMKATAKNPNNRYSSASEMAHDFSEAVRGITGTMPSFGAMDDKPTLLPGTPGAMPRPTSRSAVPAVPAVPTQAATPTQVTAPRSRLPLILGGVVVLLLVVVGVVIALPALAPKEIPITRVAQSIGTPTPFADSQMITTADYTLSIPAAWVPAQGFNDQSDSERLVHIWQDATLDSVVALVIPRNVTLTDAASFEAAVAAYIERYYAGQSQLTLIDQTTASDGTIRRSHRLESAPAPAFPPGQKDVFFIQRGAHLLVLEMYASDRLGNSLVPTFQRILDSAQVKTT